jgi:hypothetical protein
VIHDWVKSALLEVQEYSKLCIAVARGTVTRPFYFRDLIEQLDAIGLGSLTVVILTGMFTGAVLALQSGFTLDQFGARTAVGRLVSASMHKNKITGASTLWAAHDIGVNDLCVATSTNPRNGSRWYEIENLTTTPSLKQAGTLCDPAATSPRGFWIATVAESGQGHMAMGTSYASTNDFAGISTSGRLRTDALGTTRAATLALVSSTAYNLQAVDGQRWGDYSHTVVDSNDDQTFWTFQEYCDQTNSWGVQAIQIKAPAPAAPSSVSPASVCQGLASVDVTVTGFSTEPGANALTRMPRGPSSAASVLVRVVSAPLTAL